MRKKGKNHLDGNEGKDSYNFFGWVICISMIQRDGKTYKTISDVARPEFGVAPKTLQAWINKGWIDDPPKLEYGIRLIAYFPVEYIKKAKTKISEHRSRKATKKSLNSDKVTRNGS